MACYDGFGNLDDGRPIWIGNFWVWHGGTDILFYYPGDFNWWLGSIVNGQLTWSLVGNTAGFGQVADGRPFWVGDFNGTGGTDILFYYPGDFNWWLGSIVNGQLTWSLVGNTAGFGQVADGRPFWVGDFNGTGGTDILFYYPGDFNWWLGSIVNGQLTWSLVGNTAGFGQVADGRPFWVGDFNGTGGTDILFYYPGDFNWWLGSIVNGQLTWSLVGNTAGFGQVADGRPFWVGYFGSFSRQELLFYYPGDFNWWLGSIVNGQLTWSLVGNTAGFGQVADGRPFWVDDFNADARSDLLFYYPGDFNWWLGSIVNGQLTWSLVGNTAGFGQVADGRPFWTGYFRGVFRADILFYYPGDGNWWLGTINGHLNWQLVGNTGKPHRERIRLHIKIIEPTTTQAFIDTRVNAMKQIYSDNGILVEVASTENLSSNMTILPLRDLDVGTCSGAATASQGTLFANRNNVGANEVVAYFIRSTTPGALNGCATFPAGEPGAVVTSVASQWTLAHEIGHVLGLSHLPGEVCPPAGAAPTRLMTGCGTGLIVGTPTLVPSEVTTMDSSALTLNC